MDTPLSNVTPAKPVYTSKRSIGIILTAILGILSSPDVQTLIPPKYMVTITTITGIITLILQFTSKDNATITLTQGQADNKNAKALNDINQAISTGDSKSLTAGFAKQLQ
jgi:hypothetical protein